MAEDTATPKQGSFTEEVLKDDQKKDFIYVKQRIKELQQTRQNQYGHNLDQIWIDADRDYVPHRLKTKTKKVIATDEDKGWRGSIVNLGTSDWQADISQANPYVKIQTALSILVDQNPGVVLTPMNKKYQATNEIIKQLYSRSWEYAKSKSQLKLFVFNLAKYGWACARTFPLRVTRKVKVVTKFDQDNPDNTEYEDREIVEYNDIMRENLDPRNVWIDNMARPNNQRSINDWCYRKVYDYDLAMEEFGKYKRFKDYVLPGGNTQEVIVQTAQQSQGQQDKQIINQKLVEIYFYENKAKDLIMGIAGGIDGVPFMIEPLPIADAKGIKRLSLWQAYWNLRHAESAYGIGIYESIRYDQSVLDRIRNMTVDQLVLSIYKMFFYQGTQSLTDTGDIKIQPGVGRQVLDPKNVNWLEVPGPGKDAYLGIEMFRRDVDEASGITDPLIGQVTGKTAFEIAQSKEAALKRLKNPLDNILDALNDEAYTTISLMQLIYSIPETFEITDPELIEAYLKETGGDPTLYERTAMQDEAGNPMTDLQGQPQEKFNAKVYPEFPMNIGKDGKGNLIETQDMQFFRVKPECLPWEGIVSVKPQSMLAPSKQVEKALDLEMFNVLIPILQSLEQERMLAVQTGQPAGLEDLSTGKAAKMLVEVYDKDPKDIFPDAWLAEEQPQPSLFLPQNSPAAQPQTQPIGGQQPPPMAPDRVVANTQPPTEPQGIVGKMGNAVRKGFSAISPFS